MTQRAFSREHATKRLTLEWETPAKATEQAIAHEASAALLSFLGSWIEPLALELRVGCYDREIFTEGSDGNSARPAQPYHLLVREPKSSHISVSPMYPAIESGVLALASDSIESWLVRALSQSCGDTQRYETSLRELMLRASRIALPSGWADGGELLLECYAGLVRLPLVLRDGTAWVEAPPEGYVLRQPVVLSISNEDGFLQFDIEIYWSPWVQELDRSGSPLAEGIARLKARGWSTVSD